MRKSLHTILAICLAFSLSFGLLSELSADETANTNNQTENTSEEVFVIGLEAAYPPFNWSQLNDANGGVKIDGSNEYAGGYDVEIAKRVADKLGKKLVVKKIEWTGLVPAVQSGVIDAIMAGMSPTAERKEKIDFSDNYYQSSYVLLVKKDSKYVNAQSIQEFQDARITAQLGTAHYDIIDQIEGANKLPAYKNFSSMRVALDSGAIDSYVTEMPEAISSCFANPNFAIVNPEDGFQTNIEDISIAVGLKKGSPLAAEINAALAEISEEERKEIMDTAIRNQPVMEEEEEEEETGEEVPGTDGAESPDGAAESPDLSKPEDTAGKTAANRGFWAQVAFIFSKYKMLYLGGAMWTIIISIVGTVLGFFIGLLMGIVRTIPLKNKTKGSVFLIKLANLFCNIYITFFRSTPMMVQAVVFYYGLAYGGIYISPIVAGLIVVSINTGAYMAEIVRGGIVSIDRGQFEAAKAIGMTHFQTMTSIVLPQAIRNILPATANEFIVNVKDTAVLSAISVSELFFQTSTVASNTFDYFASFTVVIFIYLIMTLLITFILRKLEHKMDGPSDYNLVSNQMQLLNSTDIERLKA